MKKILLRLMDYGLKGVDTYTYNGSVWLIFTDTKQWVLELTSEKTLWYNYTFFKQLFCVATSDVTSQDKFITEWAEKNMIKPFYSTPGGHTNTETINDVIDNGVRETKSDDFNVSQRLSEDVIDYGVKETHHVDVMKFFDNKMEDTIQNGVKKTRGVAMKTDWSIETTIENGIKESICYDEYSSVPVNHNGYLDTIIQDGIKETNYDTSQYSEDVEEVIQHGIKEIYEIDWDVPNDVIDEVIDEGVIEIRDWNESIKGDLTRCVNNVIENGIKETKICNYVDPKTQLMWVKWGNQIDEVIENGVKKTSPLDPEFSVRFIDGDENNDWEIVPKINEVIDNGIKETHDDVYHHKGRIDGVIKNGDKISGTFVGGKLQKYKTDTVINYGVKETEPMDDWVNTNRIVTEVIDNGVKETKCANRYDYIGPIFKEGKIQEVIEKGIKNPTD